MHRVSHVLCGERSLTLPLEVEEEGEQSKAEKSAVVILFDKETENPTCTARTGGITGFKSAVVEYQTWKGDKKMKKCCEHLVLWMGFLNLIFLSQTYAGTPSPSCTCVRHNGVVSQKLPSCSCVKGKCSGFWVQAQSDSCTKDGKDCDSEYRWKEWTGKNCKPKSPCHSEVEFRIIGGDEGCPNQTEWTKCGPFIK